MEDLEISKRVFDLHSDLLSYLALSYTKSAYDDECRSSIPQLRAGGVGVECFAIFSPTRPRSTQFGARQHKIYESLFSRYKTIFSPLFSKEKAEISTLFSIENLSGFFEEDEPFEKGFSRLEKVCLKDRPLYISFTWNGENRFGGGAHTKVGLKADGRRLLEEGRSLFPTIDLSHASDKLAEDILDEIEKKALPYRVLASHSNFRNVCDVPRNLPDHIAERIAHRGGLIGLNIVRSFVGKKAEDLLLHAEWALRRGFEKNLALGCDFFWEKSVPPRERKKPEEHFFDALQNSSSYPFLWKIFHKAFGEKITKSIFYQNAMNFLKI
jgi:membrane dipeptidase